MTVGAGGAARYVVAGFAFGTKTAVMAAATVTSAVWVAPQAKITKVGWTVTILTDIIGGYMIATFTCSLNAIVAAGTVVFDTGMVKRRGLPAACRVAVFTVITRGWVITRFAESDLIIVAGSTTASYFIMVDFRYIIPTARAVAAVTTITTIDMVVGLGGRRNNAGGGVAGGTSAGSAFKYAFNVTAGAIKVGVLAIKHKAGT